ncbi:hypothetical protein Y032_0907g2982 [Ancylostoma ceylanicum]|uniref:Uncharacterized protein n=1 Tax=Ancylostoma ceylanicum TaxID=53326 RepID=A0A016WBG0_9BILA|nr:hypothetical protein Y032_0907g2982 [Ancylostoma ceylanicum]
MYLKPMRTLSERELHPKNEPQVPSTLPGLGSDLHSIGKIWWCGLYLPSHRLSQLNEYAISFHTYKKSVIVPTSLIATYISWE